MARSVFSPRMATNSRRRSLGPIPPDRHPRFSRIRLSAFLCRRATSTRARRHFVESRGRDYPRAAAVFAP